MKAACCAAPQAPPLVEAEAIKEFAEFNAWVAELEATPDTVTIERGVKLAESRRAALKAMIASDPRAALSRALPYAVREKLPAAVRAHLEKRVGGRGFFGVIASRYDDGRQAGLRREATIGGVRYNAHVYGRRLEQISKENVPLHGIAIDDELALDESPVRLLDPGEPPSPAAVVANADGLCPVSGAATSRSIVAESGDRIFYLCSGGHIHELAQMLMLDEGGGSAEPVIAASAWTTGNKTVLFIRVRYSDDATDPQDATSAATMMTACSNFMLENSYGVTSMTTTVTPLITLPQTKAYYTTNGDMVLYSDARAAATAAGYNYLSYQLDCVRFQGGPGSYGGQAYVGSRGCWLKSSSAGVAAHEFGHNFGLMHANYWAFTGESPIGAGSNSEYGDAYDTMGSANAGAYHYNAYEKNLLDWLPTANVTTVLSSGTYRITTFDQPNLSGSTQYALKIRKDSDRDYWVDFRQKFTSNKWMMSGADLHWDRWASSNSGSQLLDTTPNTPSGLNDSAIVIGRTFSDSGAGIHITPVGKGGTTPESLDLVVNLGSFPGNRAPAASISASATTAATGVVVTFSATASDADSDPLAYYWDFGDTNFGTNSAAASKSWSSAGDYVVRCTVSDMKGGTASDSVIVRVGSPTTFRVSGSVKDTGGNPVEGARVHNGLTGGSYRGTFTDSDGTYTITGLNAGTYTIGAAVVGYAMSAGVSTTVGPDKTGVNFTATKSAWSVSGRVTMGASGLSGVVVSDGTRTATTNSNGDYTITNIPEGSYALIPGKAGYGFSPFSLNADVFGANLTGKNFTASLNTAPTISNITDKTTAEDTATPAIAFLVNDAHTPAANLTLSAASSNAALVLPAGFVFGGSGGNRTLTITPAPNQFGTSTITVRVSDGELAGTDAFLLTVTPVPDAPVVASAPSATPNPAFTNVIVAFSVAASDPDGDALTYVWNYGDGSSGSAATHVYANPGTFNASVSVSDPSGATVAGGSVAVTVKPGGALAPTPGDSDGDGVSDENERIDGTDPNDPFSVRKTAMSVSKLSGKVSFKTGGADSCSISGTIPDLPALFDPTGAVVRIDAGGAKLEFVLDSRGKARSENGTFSLMLKGKRNPTTKKLEFPGGTVAFKAQLKKGTWGDDWADEGVDPAATTAGTPMNLVIDIALGGRLYTATPSTTYSSKAGTGGRFKN